MLGKEEIMRALVKFDKGEGGLGIRDIKIPEPEKGEVRIRVKAAGICGSDIHSMLDERETVMPVTLGHEFVGVIDKINGDTDDRLKVGDWVTGLPAAYSCGSCEYCLNGEVSLCKKRGSIGTHKNGAMAEYLIMPTKFCYKIPENVENKISYALSEPLACTVRGIYERISVKPGDIAVVSGPGTIGLFALQVLKSLGAYVIISGLPTDHHRLEKGLELGADAIAESYEELEAAVLKKNPNGADIVCETSGAVASLNVCLKIVRTHGQILQVGVFGKPATANLDIILVKELRYIGTNSTADSTWNTALKLLEDKKVNLVPLISSTLPLDDWKKAFQMVIDKSAYKVLLMP